MKKYWIFVSEDMKSFEDCAIGKQCWGRYNIDILTQREIDIGDEIIFYVGGEGFKGMFRALKKPVLKGLDKSFGCNNCKSKIKIEKVKTWNFPKIVNENIIQGCSFIKNQKRWGNAFRGKNVIGPIEPSEFDLILKQPEIPPQIFQTEDALKDYVFYNWDEMDFGESLTIFTDGEKDGKEYPVGTAGEIDFLCLDGNNDFVVLEFKKENKTSRETIGQITDYIGWVEKMLAKKNQKVRGIILSPSGFTDTLKRAASSNPKISLMKINIMFKFNKVKV